MANTESENFYSNGDTVEIKLDDAPWLPATVVGFDTVTTYFGVRNRWSVRTLNGIVFEVGDSKIRPV